MQRHETVWKRLWVIGVLLATAGGVYLRCPNNLSGQERSSSEGALTLRGLYEPRVILGRLTVRALPTAQRVTVIFLVDGKEVSRKSDPPYDLDLCVGAPGGLSQGPHLLTANAVTAKGTMLWSVPVQFLAISNINDRFSADLTPYAAHRSALDTDMDSLLRSTTTDGAKLSSEEIEIRRLVFGMYLNLGIDPSLDAGSDQSVVLMALLPSRSSPPHSQRNSTPLSMWFSPDAVFYHAIPKEWPRVALPNGYIRQVQFSTAYHGDGIGFGEVVASASDPLLEVRSQWYDVRSTLQVFRLRMPTDWSSRLPTQEDGDRHLIFIDPVSNTFVSSYKTTKNDSTGGPNALYASLPHQLAGEGDSGGSIAAGFAELPLLVQPGEATNPEKDIPHAIGGAVGRTWAARVYPATSRDAGILTSANSCTHRKFTNTGIVPYGGIIQLDPDVEIAKSDLSLPAYRILRAMQVYGYYIMDFGCADLDIYTAIDSQEIDRFGGPWGNENGPGIQNEIQAVLSRSKLYVVPPPIKR